MALYYLIDDDPDDRYEQGDEDTMLENCINSEYWENNTDWFDDYLNEYYGSVDICGRSYDSAEVLKEVDHYAYEEELSSWAENEAENETDNARYELSHTRAGNVINVCEYTIYVYEEDDKEDEEDEEVDEDVIERLRAEVAEAHKKETETHQENQNLENAFMDLFQTIQ